MENGWWVDAKCLESGEVCGRLGVGGGGMGSGGRGDAEPDQSEKEQLLLL